MDPVERKLAAVLSADAVGYSRLMSDDDEATVRTIEVYRKSIQRTIQTFRGRLVDAPGDNLLAEFPSAVGSVRCAIEIQRLLTAENAKLEPDRRMPFRIGIHLGDVVCEGERIYGDGVNIAARLEALAEPGRICLRTGVGVHKNPHRRRPTAVCTSNGKAASSPASNGSVSRTISVVTAARISALWDANTLRSEVPAR